MFPCAREVALHLLRVLHLSAHAELGIVVGLDWLLAHRILLLLPLDINVDDLVLHLQIQLSHVLVKLPVLVILLQPEVVGSQHCVFLRLVDLLPLDPLQSLLVQLQRMQFNRIQDFQLPLTLVQLLRADVLLLQFTEGLTLGDLGLRVGIVIVDIVEDVLDQTAEPGVHTDVRKGSLQDFEDLIIGGQLLIGVEEIPLFAMQFIPVPTVLQHIHRILQRLLCLEDILLLLALGVQDLEFAVARQALFFRWKDLIHIQIHLFRRLQISQILILFLSHQLLKCYPLLFMQLSHHFSLTLK